MGCKSQNDGPKAKKWRSEGLKCICAFEKKVSLGSETHFCLKHPPKSVFWYIFWYSKVHMCTMGCQKFFWSWGVSSMWSEGRFWPKIDPEIEFSDFRRDIFGNLRVIFGNLMVNFGLKSTHRPPKTDPHDQKTLWYPIVCHRYLRMTKNIPEHWFRRVFQGKMCFRSQGYIFFPTHNCRRDFFFSFLCRWKKKIILSENLVFRVFQRWLSFWALLSSFFGFLTKFYIGK